MRYVSALLYALAISGRNGLLNLAMVGGLVFCGTVALLFAIEHIVFEAINRRSDNG